MANKPHWTDDQPQTTPNIEYIKDVLSLDEMLDQDQALMLHSNDLPIMLKTKRYYQSRQLRKRSQIAPRPLPVTPVQNVPLITL